MRLHGPQAEPSQSPGLEAVSRFPIPLPTGNDAAPSHLPLSSEFADLTRIGCPNPSCCAFPQTKSARGDCFLKSGGSDEKCKAPQQEADYAQFGTNLSRLTYIASKLQKVLYTITGLG